MRIRSFIPALAALLLMQAKSGNVGEGFVENIPPRLKWRVGKGPLRAGISLDGHTVVTGELPSGKLKAWDAKTSKLIGNIGTHPGLSYFVVSADGAYVSSCDQDARVLIWSLQRGKPIATLAGNRSQHEMGFDSNGPLLAYSTPTGFAVYDCAKKETLAQARMKMPGSYQLRFDSDRRFVVLGDTSERDSGLYVWQWQANKAFKHIDVGRQIKELVRTSAPNKLVYQTLDFNPKDGLSSDVMEFDFRTSKSRLLQHVATRTVLMAYLVYNKGGREVALIHYPTVPFQLLVAAPPKGAQRYFTAPAKRMPAFGADLGVKTVIAASADGFVRLWRIN